MIAPGPARAQPSEDSVKAAFLSKFARYVAWPPSVHPAEREAIRLCIIGHDSFGPLIDRAAESELIEGRGIVVDRLSSPEGATQCHVAYVRGTDAMETANWLAVLRGRPILTVTDARFGTPRGIVHFTAAAGRVRFFIDDAEAAAAGMTISSRLLALALGVRQRR